MGRLPPRPLVDGYHLRPLVPGDLDAWLACLHDPRVHGPTSWPLVTRPELEANLARRVADGLRWAVARTDDDVLVGTCGAVHWEPAVAEVAYELAPAAWGKGLATAAVRAFLDEARAAGLPRVEAHTWVDNVASARVLERCGFAREAHLPAFRDCRGERRDYWRWGRRLEGPTPPSP